METYLIAFALFIIAALYSGVGHGGASGYIAVLSLFGYSASLIRNDALVLNILVSGIAFIQFQRAGFFQWKLFLPLILGSIPMALLGGSIKLDVHWFKIILGILLLIPAFLFLAKIKTDENNIRKIPVWTSIGIGAVLGLVSGITGIGGGVFLSPILLLGKWSRQKETAAISAPFIFVNSIAGLIGASAISTKMDSNIAIFASACFFGGLVGSMMGAWKMKPETLKGVLSVVLFIASLKLLFG